MLKSIIVDDEVKSGESLRILIEDFCDDVEVSATCTSVDEAIAAVQQHHPDVVFLDIQMQRETGFDLLEKLPEITFEVIFTTAHSEYAIKAFKFSAIDYLLKPIDLEELKASLLKVRKRLARGSPLAFSSSCEIFARPPERIINLHFPHRTDCFS
ncbi:MAG: response regulator [Bacteroidota bacterium]